MIKKILQNIYKKATYYLFLKIYGKIEKSIKPDSDKRIFADYESEPHILEVDVPSENWTWSVTQYLHRTLAIDV